MTRILRVALLASALVTPLALFADERNQSGVNKNDFLAVVGGPDSHAAAVAIRHLDPDKPGDFDLLRLVLERGTWHLRSTAASTLATARSPIAIKEIVQRLSDKTEKCALVREGMVAAVARMKDASLVPELLKALADKDAHVRRQVAAALMDTTEKTAVDALIARWKEEKNPLVANTIRKTLEAATKYYEGPNQKGWAAWWKESRGQVEPNTTDDDALAKAAEAAKKAEEEGKKSVELTTQSKDVALVHDDIGVGVPVLVLPDYGYSKELMMPFFIEVEKVAKLDYVELPTIDSFRNLDGRGGVPFYPTDKLVDAFEQVRVASKVDKIAILASGINSWIAMRYATRYPKNVVALIFVSPQSSSIKRQEAIDRMQQLGRSWGDTELFHLGMAQMFNTNQGIDQHDQYHREHNLPVPEGEAEALDRKQFSVRFANQQDSLLDELYPIHKHDLGTCLVPDFKVFSEEPVNVPVLVVAGKQSMFASEGDCEGVAKHYGAALVEFEKSGDFPFIEEPEKFSSTVTSFLVKYLGKSKKK